MKATQKQKGSVMLLAIVISVFVLIFSASVMKTVTRQVRIFSVSRESLKALAAAESGVECAVYWAYEHPWYPRNVFPTSTNSTFFPPAMPQNEVFCAGMPLNNTPTSPSPNGTAIEWNINANSAAATTTFMMPAYTVKYESFDQKKPCALVSVYREDLDLTIVSHGYSSCDVNYPGRVERVVRIDFK